MHILSAGLLRPPNNFEEMRRNTRSLLDESFGDIIVHSQWDAISLWGFAGCGVLGRDIEFLESTTRSNQAFCSKWPNRAALEGVLTRPS